MKFSLWIACLGEKLTIMYVQRQICSIMHCSMDTINAMVLLFQQQRNAIDCGLYALTFIVYLHKNNK